MEYLCFVYLLTLNVNVLRDQHQKPFEGIIEYKMFYLHQRRKPHEALAVKCLRIYKDGNIRSEYKNNQDSLLFFNLYLKKEGIQYTITPGNDTIEWYKPGPNDYVTEENNHHTEDSDLTYVASSFFGFDCKKYNIQIRYSDFPDELFTYDYWVADALFIDEKDKGPFGGNFIFPFSGHIILKYTIDNPVFKVIEAEKLTRKKIASDYFHFDKKNKVFVKI